MKLFTAIIIASASLGAAVAVDPAAVRHQDETAPMDGLRAQVIAVASDVGLGNDEATILVKEEEDVVPAAKDEAENKHFGLLRGAADIPAPVLHPSPNFLKESVGCPEGQVPRNDGVCIASSCFINDNNACESMDWACECRKNCCGGQTWGECCDSCNRGKDYDICYEHDNMLGSDNCYWDLHTIYECGCTGTGAGGTGCCGRCDPPTTLQVAAPAPAPEVEV